MINADASDSISGGSPVIPADAAWQNPRPQKKETEVSLILNMNWTLLEFRSHNLIDD